jgi:hypothetical protein
MFFILKLIYFLNLKLVHFYLFYIDFQELKIFFTLEITLLRKLTLQCLKSCFMANALLTFAH